MKYIKKYIYIISFIILLILIVLFIITKNNLIKEENDIVTDSIEKESINEEIDCKLIMVDIKGEVVNPGVYELDDTKRVIDVINLAGGLAEKADTSLINLSKKISDEMVIIIYSNDEIKKEDNEIVTKIVEKECICPEIKNDSCIENYLDSGISDDNKLSLNSCTKEQLLEISGIGEKKADAIIDYRSEYGFNKIDDLLSVDGIGNSVYEKIKIYFKL